MVGRSRNLQSTCKKHDNEQFLSPNRQRQSFEEKDSKESTKVNKRFFFYIVQFLKITFVILLFLDSLLNDAFEEIIAFQRALKEMIAAADTDYSKKYEEFFIGFEGRY